MADRLGMVTLLYKPTDKTELKDWRPNCLEVSWVNWQTDKLMPFSI